MDGLLFFEGDPPLATNALCMHIIAVFLLPLGTCDFCFRMAAHAAQALSAVKFTCSAGVTTFGFGGTLRAFNRNRIMSLISFCTMLVPFFVLESADLGLAHLLVVEVAKV